MIFSTKHMVWFSLLSAVFLAACKTTPSPEASPALLTQMDEGAKDALTLAVSKAVGSNVTLAPDSFMKKSSVTIEPASVNKRDGRIIDGRTLERPSHVDLIMMGNNCYVVNRETGEKVSVQGVDCKPLIQDL